jgi:ribosomal protein S18 acetylase RimI-like enzyme
MAASDRVTFREEVRPDDAAAVRAIVASTGFFYDHEIDVAVELVEERLQKGLPSGYLFLFAEREGRAVGYCCYGEIACTQGSYDLYWIAVHDQCRGQGIGRVLLKKCEQRIADLGGRCVWVETSGQGKYRPTRDFYVHNQYAQEAVLKDFYGSGDDKFIFVKRLCEHG